MVSLPPLGVADPFPRATPQNQWGGSLSTQPLLSHPKIAWGYWFVHWPPQALYAGVAQPPLGFFFSFSIFILFTNYS